ncbi:hypothetical protein CHARACLAT_009733 [Characodon lateralis]|uniref:Fibronectin type-III domain-containing protein n=1 Tax=Characodon lateralis TaxID=208331 RepID=A0ABU7F462_9TELE|nr:hypothetical protein [Characodon lateralis]
MYHSKKSKLAKGFCCRKRPFVHQSTAAASEFSTPDELSSPHSLSPPVNVTIKEVKANSAVVSWDIPEGDPVIGFAITQQKKDVRMLRFIQEVNTTTRSCALWDLEEETDYIVHVQSISMSGTSPLSEPLRFRTPKEAETQASKIWQLSFIFYNTYSIVGHRGAGAYLQQSTGKRQGTPGQVASPLQGNTATYRTNNHAQTHSHCGRKQENMQSPCRKTPSRKSDPGPSCYKATGLPTATPCSRNGNLFLKSKNGLFSLVKTASRNRKKVQVTNYKVCDWCKHIRHTKEYLDFGAGERRLQFCSAKCLNQYKMDIFYKETQAALPGALCNPGHGAGGEGKPECSGGVQLLTPESWGTPLTDLRRKAPSPAGHSGTSALVSSTSSATSPSETTAVCSPSSSTSAKIPTPRPHESPLPPPPVPLHPPVGVPSGSPPMVMTPRGPMPLPLFMEHQMMQQIRPPFFRPSTHPAGPNSPLSNPIIPGIGPPPPPRTLGPASSPMHRPLLSPHVHHSSNPNPSLIPPHPGLPMPGLPPFPPINMMPNGHIPLPPMMNFGMPSLAPLVPPPTLLVPYPIIVPLPVPIPIPIPIPFNSKTSRDQPESSSSVHSAPDSSEASSSRPHSPSSSGSDKGDHKPASGEQVSPVPGERRRTAFMDLTVKAEENPGSLCLSMGPELIDGVIDLTVGQKPGQQQLIQTMLAGVKVKVEESRSPPADGFGSECMGNGGDNALLPQGSFTELDTDTHRKSLDSAAPPSSKTDLPGSQLNPNFKTAPLHTSVRTQSLALPQLQANSAAPCNVIVNGTGWHSLLNPDRKGEREWENPPNNGDLEHEALKENNCSVAEAGKRISAQVEKADTETDSKPNPDSSMEEGEHAYALPLLSAGGCVVIQPVPKPATDKTAILSCSISTPLSAGGSPELEPPLKRRCLRIRNQNK